MKTNLGVFAVVLLVGAGLLMLHLWRREPEPVAPDAAFTTEVEVAQGEVALKNLQGDRLYVTAGQRAVMTGASPPESVKEEAPRTKTALREPASKPEPRPDGFGQVTGKVMDIAGKPVPQCEAIFLRRESSDIRDFAERGRYRESEPYAVTDASGVFLARQLPPDTYVIAWRAPGYIYRAYDDPVEVRPGELTENILQTLERAGRIEGKVVENLTGKPIAGAKVSAGVVSSNRHEGAIITVHRKISTICDAEGNFRLDVLLPFEEYDLTAEHGRYIPATKPGIPVDTAERVQIVMNPGATIEGQVVLEEDQSPIEGAKVFALREGKVEKEVASATAGRFRVEGLRSGQYLFKAQTGERVTLGDEKDRRKIALSGQNAPLELELIPGGVIELTLLDGSSGRPVPGAEVALENEDWQSPIPSELEKKTTDEIGKARWVGLEAVEIGYRVKAKGYAERASDWDERIKTGPGQLVSRTVELAPGQRVAGRVVDERERPVAGARVEVDSTYDASGFGGHYWGSSIRTTSGPDGSFLLNDLSPGWVDLLAQKEGYALAKALRVEVGQTDLQLVLREGALLRGVVLNAQRQPAAGASVRLYFSQRQAGIEGRLQQDSVLSGDDGWWTFEHLEAGTYEVFAQHGQSYSERKKNIQLGWSDQRNDIELILKEGVRVAGRVLDRRSEKGIEGVTLRLQLESSRTYTAEHQSESSSDGAFEFVGVPSGNYVIRAAEVPKEYFSPGWEALAQFIVGREAVEDLVVHLQPGASVRGKVVLPSGEGTTADLILSHDDLARLKLGNRRDEKSGEDGAFELTGLLPASGYRLFAKKPGYALADSGPFNLKEGETREDLVLQLSAPGRISGTIKDQDGKPVTEDYYVKAQIDGFRTVYSQYEHQANPDDSGFYRLEDLPAGIQRIDLIQVTKMGQMSSHSSRQHKDAKVVAGQETTGVDFVIERKKLEGYIAGRVVDKQGRGIAGMMVNVHALRRGAGQPEEGTTGAAVSGPDGRFRIEGLAEGPFSGYTHPQAAGLYDVFAQGTVPEVVSPADNVEVLVERLGAVSGRVVKKGKNEPVKSFRAAVFVRNYLPEMQPFMDAEGRFSIERVIPGAARLRVEVEGVGVFEKTFEVGDGEHVKDILVEVGEPIGIRGRVVRKEDGQPVEGAKIIPLSLNRVEHWMDHISFSDEGHTYSDAAGQFTLTGIASGIETLYVEHPGYGLVEQSGISVPEGGLAEGVVIELEQPGALEGHVFDEGKPIEGAKIVVSGLPNRAFERTDQKGHYQFALLPPGRYRVVWEKSETGYQLNPARNTEIRSGEVAVADFGKGGATLFGAVTRFGGPVEGIEVSLMTAPYVSTGGSRTNNRGEYRISAIQPGPYQLSLVENGKGVYRAEIEIPDQGEVERNVSLPTASLSGCVTDAQTRKPLEMAMIRLLEEPEASGAGSALWRYEFETQSGNDGEYELTGLPAGTYRLMVSHSSYGSQAVQLPLAEGESRDGFNFTLHGGGALRLRLKDAADGTFLAGRVEFFDEDRRTVLPGSAKGEYQDTTLEYQGLPAGRLLVVAYAQKPSARPGERYAPASRWLEVIEGQTQESEIACAEGMQILLRVLDEEGRELTDASISLVDSSGQDRAALPFHPLAGSGWVVLEQGSYQLTVESKGYREYQETLVMRFGETPQEKTVTLTTDG